MNFESIARKACERQDYVGAVVTLSRGLKRLDDVDCEAFDLLIDLYANCCQAPGLEREVADVLVRHFDVGLVSGQIIACLEARELFSMSRAFHREISSRGVLIETVSLESLTQEEERFDLDEPSEPIPVIEDVLDVEPSEPLHLPTPEDAPRELPIEDAPVDQDSEEVDDLPPDEPVAFPTSVEEESEAEFEAPREIEWTDEQDREVHSPALDPLPIKSSGQIAPQSSPESPRRSWRVPAILLVLALLGLGAFMIFSPPRGARVQALEQQLEAFDTLNPAAFDLLLGEQEQELDEDARARMNFARMLLALERGDVLPSHNDTTDGVWSRGASVFQALQRRDVEAALAHVEAMERRWPDALATLWTRARLEEERGHFEDAQRAYALAMHRTPRFLPGLMGSVRVAFYQGDHDELEKAQGELRDLNPLHPYLSIYSDPLQRAIVHPSEPGAASAELQARSLLSETSPDRFARAYNAYLNAYQLRERGDLSAAHTVAREALSLSPYMSPALLLQGSILAAQLRVDEASKIFARYAALEQLEVQARLALMVYAPRALTRAGRPDLALIFALDPGGESARSRLILAAGEPLVEQQEQWRPISLNLTREQRDQHAVSAGLALAELAWALIELGAAQDALQLTRQLNADTYPFLDDVKWFAYAVMGATQRLTDLAYQHREEPIAPYPELLAALANAEFMHAHEVVTAHPELARRQMLWLRASTRAQLVATPRPDVLSSLDRVEFAAVPGELARQRMLVWTMLEPTHKKVVELRETQLESQPTSLHALLDMAHVALWLPDMELARRDLDAARLLAAEHPEVTYLESLMLALSSDERGLKELFKRSSLSVDDPVWVLDVGELALRHKLPSLAYEYFSKLKRINAVSPALLDRLGRALGGLDATQAGKVLAGLEARYQGSEDTVHRSKVLRWTAVIAGVRKGKREANVSLDRALALEGVPQDELWLEQGRYFMAIEQNKRARDSFTQALRYNSSLADVHAELGELALADDQFDKARDHFIKYLEARPYGVRSTLVRQKLDRLQLDSQSPTPAQEAAAP